MQAKIMQQLSKVGVIHDTRPSPNAFAVLVLAVCVGRWVVFFTAGA